MNGSHHGFAMLASIVLTAACVLPLSATVEVADKQGPRYWDDAVRQVIPGRMPFALPASSDNTDASLQIRRLCVQGHEVAAQAYFSHPY